LSGASGGLFTALGFGKKGFTDLGSSDDLFGQGSGGQDGSGRSDPAISCADDPDAGTNTQGGDSGANVQGDNPGSNPEVAQSDAVAGEGGCERTWEKVVDADHPEDSYNESQLWCPDGNTEGGKSIDSTIRYYADGSIKAMSGSGAVIAYSDPNEPVAPPQDGTRCPTADDTPQGGRVDPVTAAKVLQYVEQKLDEVGQKVDKEKQQSPDTGLTKTDVTQLSARPGCFQDAPEVGQGGSVALPDPKQLYETWLKMHEEFAAASAAAVSSVAS
jgi:hypothetical protein